MTMLLSLNASGFRAMSSPQARLAAAHYSRSFCGRGGQRAVNSPDSAVTLSGHGLQTSIGPRKRRETNALHQPPRISCLPRCLSITSRRPARDPEYAASPNPHPLSVACTLMVMVNEAVAVAVGPPPCFNVTQPPSSGSTGLTLSAFR